MVKTKKAEESFTSSPFKITLRDIILMAPIFITLVSMWVKLGEVEQKVDTIYNYYVIEGLQGTYKFDGTPLNNPTNTPFPITNQSMSAILPHDLKINKKKTK